MLLGCVNKSQPWPWAWHSEFQISGWEDTVCTNGCWIAGAQLIYQITCLPASGTFGDGFYLGFTYFTQNWGTVVCIRRGKNELEFGWSHLFWLYRWSRFGRSPPKQKEPQSSSSFSSRSTSQWKFIFLRNPLLDSNSHCILSTFQTKTIWFPHDANITFDVSLSSIRILLQMITLWILSTLAYVSEFKSRQSGNRWNTMRWKFKSNFLTDLHI